MLLFLNYLVECIVHLAHQCLVFDASNLHVPNAIVEIGAKCCEWCDFHVLNGENLIAYWNQGPMCLLAMMSFFFAY